MEKRKDDTTRQRIQEMIDNPNLEFVRFERGSYTVNTYKMTAYYKIKDKDNDRS